MAKQIVLLSGPVSGGKSTLARALSERFGCRVVRTQELIRSADPQVAHERSGLQLAGELLDKRTRGGWVSRELSKIALTLPPDSLLIVDSVRIKEQIAAARQAFGPRVVHLHLTAPTLVLERRYRKRRTSMKELSSYKLVQKNRTEAQIEQLAEIADVVIDTDRCSADDVAVRAASHLGYYGRSYVPLVDVLVGGEYGSEGKGHIAAYLAPEYDILIRVGGPNAGHTVFGDPPYTHHQLPSGTTRAAEAQLVIGPGATIDVDKLTKEIADCGVSRDRLAIDPQAVIITEQDKVFERKKLVGSIGSTAQGVGKASARRILRGAGGKVLLARDIAALKQYVHPARDVLDEAFYRGRKALLEGTQGTGLSIYHGHYPYVTSRDTTVSGCLAESGIAPTRVRKVIMVCRSYPIRVGGASGPMTTEISWPEVSRRSGIPVRSLRVAERTSTTRRKRRVGEFDWVLLRTAASLNAPTDIALTFVDYLSVDNRKARRFEQLRPETIRFIVELERVAAAPVSLISTRFDYRSIIDRRAW
ncbi:MAG: adenylosuccinate synthetase [Gemmatimonadaceae bacterium]